MPKPKNPRTSKAKRPRRGGILAAFRNSPLVGADIDLTRDNPPARKVELPDRVAPIERLKKFRGRLPADFKFDRDKANEG